MMLHIKLVSKNHERITNITNKAWMDTTQAETNPQDQCRFLLKILKPIKGKWSEDGCARLAL